MDNCSLGVIANSWLAEWVRWRTHAGILRFGRSVMRVDGWIPRRQMLWSVFDGMLLLRFITNKRHGGGVVVEDLWF